MKIRKLKKQLKRYIKYLLRTFEMFDNVPLNKIILHEDEYFKRGYFTIKDIPFRYEMDVVDGEIERIQIHVALDKYYKSHLNEDSEEIKEMKMYLHKIDTILVGRFVDNLEE